MDESFLPKRQSLIASRAVQIQAGTDTLANARDVTRTTLVANERSLIVSLQEAQGS